MLYTFSPPCPCVVEVVEDGIVVRWTEAKPSERPHYVLVPCSRRLGSPNYGDNSLVTTIGEAVQAHNRIAELGRQVASFHVEVAIVE